MAVRTSHTWLTTTGPAGGAVAFRRRAVRPGHAPPGPQWKGIRL